MPLVPIAAFLTGALLSLLLPVLLLIALVVWYWLFSRRVPDTTDSSEPGRAPTAADPAPAAPSLAPTAPSDTSSPAHRV